MPRGIVPRRPSRSGRQQKVLSGSHSSKRSLSRAPVRSEKDPALAKGRLERGTHAKSIAAPRL